MQAIGETAFDAVYLTFALVTGIILLVRGRSYVRLFGAMALVLAAGDSFHLIPRCYALFTDGLAAHRALLGTGKLITSVTMTLFYIILYYIWMKRYGKGTEKLTLTMWVLAALRIILCLFPQNGWTSPDPSLFWGILRNIPFAAIGIILIVLFQKTVGTDDPLRHMGLAIALSFGFYIPVVLFADVFPAVGMLMIPKTLAYVWVVVMGIKLYKKER
ncbi:MAG: hypothetical protein ACI4NM_00770 [Bullifex sp.]